MIGCHPGWSHLSSNKSSQIHFTAPKWQLFLLNSSYKSSRLGNQGLDMNILLEMKKKHYNTSFFMQNKCLKDIIKNHEISNFTEKWCPYQKITLNEISSISPKYCTFFLILNPWAFLKRQIIPTSIANRRVLDKSQIADPSYYQTMPTIFEEIRYKGTNHLLLWWQISVKT